MARRFTKIKLADGSKLYLAYEQTPANNPAIWDEYTMTCSERGKPSLYAALDALKQQVICMCELPAEYIQRLTMKGISLSYAGEDEVMGATLTATMHLQYSNAPLVLNTPHKPSEPYSGNNDVDPHTLLTDDCVAAIENLCEECEAYLDGDRMQLELPLN